MHIWLTKFLAFMSHTNCFNVTLPDVAYVNTYPNSITLGIPKREVVPANSEKTLLPFRDEQWYRGVDFQWQLPKWKKLLD